MSGQRLNSIHFLRFVAVMAVVVHHFPAIYVLASGRPQAWIVGAAGVEVFFVISGVVIGLAIDHYGTIDFVARRWIRIVPLHGSERSSILL